MCNCCTSFAVSGRTPLGIFIQPLVHMPYFILADAPCMIHIFYLPQRVIAMDGHWHIYCKPKSWGELYFQIDALPYSL